MKAFPTTRNSQDGVWYTEDGMELRDYFAAKAMQGFMNCYGDNIKYTKDELIATASYDLADAMMKARANETN